ncbi:hypothetical protein GBAR_LOCUS12818 [Geodia barretti]|uniref:Uncharacterized protein n=1 Tax=Geodia barretti TaxID=519541 RepID=A0AA35S2X8_GEOBA|nr:hypothetical protein GBAR_LOCUS12818 [Geodia barretti]
MYCMQASPALNIQGSCCPVWALQQNCWISLGK